MIKTGFAFFIFLSSMWLSAQTAISGNLNLSDSILGQKIYLVKVSPEEGGEHVQQVAWSKVQKDGSFSFRSNHISDKDAMYRLYVEKVEQVIKDTITSKKDFILSNNDKISFANGLSAGYINSSDADMEWLKLKQYQQELSNELKISEHKNSVEDTISEAYAAKLKGYTKDSLKILLVKLIGVRQLAEKGLLDTDIIKNPDFYLNLLSELKASDMPSKEYQFLSRRLAFLTQDIVAEKYEWSKAMNIFLVVALLGLVLFMYRLKRRKNIALPDLSKQELNVKALILQGKSNKEIANELFISVSTVKTHITNIYGKLQVSNRKELVQKARN